MGVDGRARAAYRWLAELDGNSRTEIRSISVCNLSRHGWPTVSRLRTDREDLHRRYWQSVRNFEDQAKHLETDRLEHPFYEDHHSDYLRYGVPRSAKINDSDITTSDRRKCGDRLTRSGRYRGI